MMRSMAAKQRRALVLLLVLGCKRSTELKRVELPGFSLELPASVHYTGDGKTDYRAGTVRDVGDGLVVFVGWQFGEIASVDEMPVAVRAIVEAVPALARIELAQARSVEIGGQKATRIDSKIEDVAVTFADITCGKRSVMLGFGAARDFEATRDRILASFQCHPAAADEALAEAAPIGVDDPAVLAGWSRVANEDAFAMTNGRLAVVAVGAPSGGSVTGVLHRMIPTLFASIGAKWQERGRETHGGREYFRGTMTADGEETPGVIAAWPCGDGGDDALIVLALAPEDALDDAIAFIGKLRCARATDAPLFPRAK